ncbi:MAG: BamA/TamA family outer membrane protein [Longimicrobiales bacterium]
MKRSRGIDLPALIVALALPGPLFAQVARTAPPASAAGDTVVVVPGSEYAADGLKRLLLGSGWRDVWLVPIEVPVLDLDAYGVGLEPVERGGGAQSITLHFENEAEEEYVFRSVNKFPQQGLPHDLAYTPVGALFEDQISVLLPAAPILMPPFLEALDILHVPPRMFVMPDDPRLGEFRDTFAGMLGTMELQPNEGPDDTPGWLGSRAIKGTEEFLNDIEDSPAHQLDAHELLAARLVDFLVNDTDRGSDQWRWARFGEEGDYVWRPIPRDRDWAFVHGDAPILRPLRGAYPKYIPFGPRQASIEAVTFSSYYIDRRLLNELTRQDFAEVGSRVQAGITDQVIAQTLALMPAMWRSQTAVDERIAEALRARLETLPALATSFYEWLAYAPDIHATDVDDRVVVERRSDGSVDVAISADEAARNPYFRRHFVPDETREVRLDLHGGDDYAIVRGAPTAEIVVRIIGGGDHDVLVDSAGGGATAFYDEEGDNQFVTASGTLVSTKEWDEVEPEEGFRSSDWAPDWGGVSGWGPAFGYGEAAGPIIGFGWTAERFGFRKLPHAWSVQARLLYALDHGGFGAELGADYRFENSPMLLSLDATAVQYDAFRFYGYGNDTPEIDAGLALVDQDLLRIEPALGWDIGWRARGAEGIFEQEEEEEEGEGEQEQEQEQAEREETNGLRPLVGRLEVGPTVSWTDPSPGTGSPLATIRPIGTDATGLIGGRVSLSLDRTDRDAAPRRGWRLEARAAGYPDVWDAPGGFGVASAQLSGYIPLIGDGPHLALRAAGATTVGELFPVQHSVRIGGRTTLRGYRWQRFAGESGAWGSTELRVPIDSVEVFVRGELGVFGLADAARVWFDGASDGGWHTGYGGGLWFASLGRAVSIAYARGEGDRFYIQFGLPF